MKTALIPGKAVAKIDKQIIGNLLLTQVSVDIVKEEKMIIGIRNEAGDIYRLIGATRVNSYMNAIEELFDLEMSDELDGIEEAREGCDAIFSFT
ncbi:hypothetical protein LPB67_17065 [Undibacterium sp. Jales W-56]|uniref:hypothetical protein n=1 Tax=Undibacterium sp. Jales W-56 TaxID=2897325 RepID=UPI0021CEE001|nr:hypothetical protein [Undibacterium sp. Jales W-56]MCU6435490.1 hypothetical protein [Undibacterium sp. Jales W-56]